MDGGSIRSWRSTAWPARGSARVAEERELSAVAGRPPAQPRVVAFVAGKGGVGTTSVAAGLGLTLATLLPGQVALADTGTGRASLGRLLGGPPGPDAATFAAGAVEPVRVADVAVVDGAPWDTPLTRPTLARLVADLRMDYRYVLLDVGNDAGEIGHGALARADRAVVVTTSAQDAVAAAERTLERLHHLDLELAEASVVAGVGIARLGRGGATGRWRPDEPLVTIPWDPMVAAGSGIDIDRLKRVTRAAFLRLAAVLSEDSTTPARVDT
jgi:MinD-like ATPase involved in chromosome partitioning or flagellar assembly